MSMPELVNIRHDRPLTLDDFYEMEAISRSRKWKSHVAGKPSAAALERSFKVKGHDARSLCGQRWTFMSIGSIGTSLIWHSRPTVKTIRAIFTFVTSKWPLHDHSRSHFLGGFWKSDIDYFPVFDSSIICDMSISHRLTTIHDCNRQPDRQTTDERQH